MTRSTKRHLALLVVAGALACVHGPSGRDRRSAEIHHDLGVEALRAGRFPDALSELDAALAIDPEFAEAHRSRGFVLQFGFGKLDEAEKEYRRAVAVRAGYSEAHNDLGQLLAATGRYEEAIREFDVALENMLYKEPYIARCNKGLALHHMGRKDEGISAMRACIAAAPGYCKGRRELGLVLLSEKRTQEALGELSSYARLCEKLPDAHLQLGLARMKSGDLAGARAELKRCSELGEGTAEGDECRRSLSLLE